VSAPNYVRRFARVTRAMPILAMHPAGMRLDDLATQLRTSEEELRDEIRAYYVADVTAEQMRGGYREPLIEFAARPAGDDDEWDDYPDPADAAYVRLRDLRPVSDVGTKFLSLGELAAVSRAGYDVLAAEPENTVLEAALDKLGASVLDGFDAGGPRWLGDKARKVRQAVREQRRVRIDYARAWQPGVVERLIEPYRVVHTRRGWEVDASVPGEGGKLRTFLVSGIQDLDILSETFTRPSDVDDRIEANRREAEVDVVVPHGARWAVELYAESAELVVEEEKSVTLRARLLPPIERRLGLLLIAAGGDAAVVGPSELADAGRQVAAELLEHHASR
jgi:predicted DNA-binding transcriptional regulator YafY